jgi:pimeloyl-ACP methyl ester carboxylesterase
VILPLLLMVKPLALFVHGAGGGGWEYKIWKTEFEKAGYKVVAPDLEPTGGKYENTTFDDYISQIVSAAHGQTPTVLAGASMGGVLVIKAAEQLHPKTLILACATQPKGIVPPKADLKPNPPLIQWANGPYKDTVDSMPDSDEATRKFAWPRWRNESGQVLNAVQSGVECQAPTCPVLSIIPEADDTIPPADQQALAAAYHADTHRYAGMSHVGTLLSTRAQEVAKDAIAWIRKRLRR